MVDQFFARMKAIAPDGVLTDVLGPFNRYWVDGANGNDGADGRSYKTAFKTLAKAYAMCVDGKNDSVILVGNGSTTATARVDTAFTWAKSATHLIGVCPPNSSSLRARIAPTPATTAFTPFFTISGNGCYFKNIQWWHGFTTGTATQINVIVDGAKNRFENCHFAGMGDATSAAGANSRCLKIGAGGDNEFFKCTIGEDTITRTAANALVEFYAASARNKFVECLFLSYCTSVQTQLDLFASGAGAHDRWQLFESCEFINSIKSGSALVQTSVSTLSASSGGMLVFKDCCLVGHTGYGPDATTRGQVYVIGSIGTAGTSGISVNPTA